MHRRAPGLGDAADRRLRPRGRSATADVPAGTSGTNISSGEEMRASSWPFEILFKRTKSLIVAVGPVGAVGKRAPGWPGVVVRGCPRAEGNHLPSVRVPSLRPRGCPRPGRVHRPPCVCTALAFWRLVAIRTQTLLTSLLGPQAFPRRRDRDPVPRTLGNLSSGTMRSRPRCSTAKKRSAASAPAP